MKLPTTFLNLLLRNEALQVSVAVERDILEIERRFEHEGMSFLTITLPILDDALVQGVTQGRITPNLFEGFKPYKRGGKLPALLSGFFMRVFELDGSLKDRPCIASIRAIHQVTRTFKKVELPCSAARVKRAFERYRSNDESVDDTPTNGVLLSIISGYLWSDLETLSGTLFCSQGVFGTGATAERLAFNERHSIRQWPERSEPWFPLSYHGSHREDDTETFAGIEYVSPDGELPVRVVQVPKTLKTPRIISVEPSYMMLMQQSIAKPLMAYLESEHFKYNSIRFTDQKVNREMARLGSIPGGNLATIDLKDASDMVSNTLVNNIFSVCPGFLDLIQACRSSRAQLPDGSVLNLRKFASQGSAMCFPIEAMVFFTIVLYSIVRHSGRRPSRKLLSEIAANVSVYGDDIIVPAETASGVMEDLESFGLKVNLSKSFHTGLFRESCGGDYYDGVDITPTYVTTWDLTGTSRDSRVLAAYVSLSNQFYMKGLWHVSQHIRDHVQRNFGPIQSSTRTTGVYTFASMSFDTGLRYDVKSSGWRLKGPLSRVGRKQDAIKDIRAGMLACFSGRGLLDGINSLVESDWKDHEDRFIGSYGLRVGAMSSNDNASNDSISWGKIDFDYPSKIESPSVPRRGHVEIGSTWLDWMSNGRSLSHLEEPTHALDLTSSVDSYVSNTKRKWTPAQAGLPGWLKTA